LIIIVRNDGVIDIIRECGIGVAMGNAEKGLKEIADIIAETNDNDGVARVLEEKVLREL
jgi:5-amino-6-(5-phospho-D-ribitylamino)uracil phosphatase